MPSVIFTSPCLLFCFVGYLSISFFTELLSVICTLTIGEKVWKGRSVTCLTAMPSACNVRKKIQLLPFDNVNTILCYLFMIDYQYGLSLSSCNENSQLNLDQASITVIASHPRCAVMLADDFSPPGPLSVVFPCTRTSLVAWCAKSS